MLKDPSLFHNSSITDCNEYVYKVLNKVGISSTYGKTAADMFYQLKADGYPVIYEKHSVYRDSDLYDLLSTLKEGDIIFHEQSSQGYIHHVAIVGYGNSDHQSAINAGVAYGAGEYGAGIHSLNGGIPQFSRFSDLFTWGYFDDLTLKPNDAVSYSFSPS